MSYYSATNAGASGTSHPSDTSPNPQTGGWASTTYTNPPIATQPTYESPRWEPVSSPPPTYTDSQPTYTPTSYGSSPTFSSGSSSAHYSGSISHRGSEPDVPLPTWVVIGAILVLGIIAAVVVSAAYIDGGTSASSKVPPRSTPIPSPSLNGGSAAADGLERFLRSDDYQKWRQEEWKKRGLEF